MTTTAEVIYDVAVIGAGEPAWAAAAEAVRRGRSVALFEQAPASEERELDGRLALHVAGAVVWAIQDGTRVCFTAPGGSRHIRAQRIVLAEAPRPRVLPFPGWEREEVSFAADPCSAADAVARAGAGPVVLAGAGDPLRRALDELRARGVAAAVVIDALPGGGTAVPAGTRLMARAGVVAAEGGERLRRLRVAEVDGGGAAVPGTGRTIEAGALVCAFGGVPGVRLAAAAGCELRLDARQQAWRARCGADRRSSLATVWVAGDSGDPDLDRMQGAVAGAAASASLAGGGAPAPSAPTAFLAVEPVEPPTLPARDLRGVVAALPANVALCPCERVTLGDVRRAVRAGLTGMDDVKKATGCAMGLCQGARCDLLLAAAVADAAGRSMEEVGTLRPRIPAAPITLGDAAGIVP